MYIYISLIFLWFFRRKKAYWNDFTDLNTLFRNLNLLTIVVTLLYSYALYIFFGFHCLFIIWRKVLCAFLGVYAHWPGVEWCCRKEMSLIWSRDVFNTRWFNMMTILNILVVFCVSRREKKGIMESVYYCTTKPQDSINSLVHIKTQNDWL